LICIGLTLFPSLFNGFNLYQINSVNSLGKPIPSQFSLININYTLSYDIQSINKKEQGLIPFQLFINGSNGMLEQGTIDYYVEKNITSSSLLRMLSLFFSSSQLNYFQNHASDEPFQSKFSERKEIPLDSSNNYNTGLYSLFWLNTTSNPIGGNYPHRNVKFFQVSAPFIISIDAEMPIVAQKSWSQDLSDLRQNVPLIKTFFLSYGSKIANNEETQINLYYDATWTLLLRAEILYNNFANTSADDYKINIKLDDSSLEFQYEATNPYWMEYQQMIQTTILVGIICGIVISILLIIYRKRNQSDFFSKSKHNDSISPEKTSSSVDYQAKKDPQKKKNEKNSLLDSI
jgi:hypothetical protein